MEIILFIEEHPDRPAEARWFVDVPQLLTHQTGPTREIAVERAIIEALDNIVFYLKSNRLSPSATTTLQFTEETSPKTKEERAKLWPDWYHSADLSHAAE